MADAIASGLQKSSDNAPIYPVHNHLRTWAEVQSVNHVEFWIYNSINPSESAKLHIVWFKKVAFELQINSHLFIRILINFTALVGFSLNGRLGHLTNLLN